MVVQVDYIIIRRSSDEGPEQFTYTEYAIIGMVYICRKDGYPFQILEKRRKPGTGNDSDFNIQMRPGKRTNHWNDEGHVAHGGKAENQNLYDRHISSYRWKSEILTSKPEYTRLPPGRGLI